MRETRVWSLVQEGPACGAAIRPVHHHSRACAPGRMSHKHGGQRALQATPHEKGRCAMKSQLPAPGVQPPLATAGEKPAQQQDPLQPNTIKFKSTHSLKRHDWGPLSPFKTGHILSMEHAHLLGPLTFWGGPSSVYEACIHWQNT